MCAWTYSSLRKLNLPLMTELGRHCRERVNTLTPQNLAWVASSFAKLNVRDEVLYTLPIITTLSAFSNSCSLLLSQ
jgi:hypothetical protein